MLLRPGDKCQPDRPLGLYVDFTPYQFEWEKKRKIKYKVHLNRSPINLQQKHKKNKTLCCSCAFDNVSVFPSDNFHVTFLQKETFNNGSITTVKKMMVKKYNWVPISVTIFSFLLKAIDYNIIKILKNQWSSVTTY